MGGINDRPVVWKTPSMIEHHQGECCKMGSSKHGRLIVVGVDCFWFDDFDYRSVVLVFLVM
jgi:hypothetical protein